MSSSTKPQATGLKPAPFGSKTAAPPLPSVLKPRGPSKTAAVVDRSPTKTGVTTSVPNVKTVNKSARPQTASSLIGLKQAAEPKTPEQPTNAKPVETGEPKPSGHGYVGTPRETPQATQPKIHPSNPTPHPISFDGTVRGVKTVVTLDEMISDVKRRNPEAIPVNTPAVGPQGPPVPPSGTTGPAAPSEPAPVPVTPNAAAPVPAPPVPVTPSAPDPAAPIPVTPSAPVSVVSDTTGLGTPTQFGPGTPPPTVQKPLYSTRVRKSKRTGVSNTNNKTLNPMLEPHREKKVCFTNMETEMNFVYGKDVGLTPAMIDVQTKYADGHSIETKKTANKKRDGMLTSFVAPTEGPLDISASSESHDFGPPLKMQARNLEDVSPDFLVNSNAIQYTTTRKALDYICAVLGLYPDGRRMLPRSIRAAQQFVMDRLLVLYPVLGEEVEGTDRAENNDQDKLTPVQDDEQEDYRVLENAPVIPAMFEIGASNTFAVKIVQIIGAKLEFKDQVFKLMRLDVDSNPPTGLEAQPQFRVFRDSDDVTGGLSTLFLALQQKNLHGVMSNGSETFYITILANELLLVYVPPPEPETSPPKATPPEKSKNKTTQPSPPTPIQEVIIEVAKPVDEAFRRFLLPQHVPKVGPAPPASSQPGVNKPAGSSGSSPKFWSREDRMDHLLQDLADLPLHKKRQILDVLKIQSELLIERFENHLRL